MHHTGQTTVAVFARCCRLRTLHNQYLEQDLATKVLQSKAPLREMDEKQQSHVVRQTFMEALSAPTVGEVKRSQPEGFVRGNGCAARCKFFRPSL